MKRFHLSALFFSTNSKGIDEKAQNNLRGERTSRSESFACSREQLPFLTIKKRSGSILTAGVDVRGKMDSKKSAKQKPHRLPSGFHLPEIISPGKVCSDLFSYAAAGTGVDLTHGLFTTALFYSTPYSTHDS